MISIRNPQNLDRKGSELQRSLEYGMNCLNCDTQYEGHFCPQCGQRSQTKRLTILSVTKDFLDALSDSDKGFLKTVIDLFKNPGKMLNDYIFGRRKRYLSAGKYTFFLIVLFTIHLSYLEHHNGWFQRLTNSLDHISVTENKNIKDKKTIEKPSLDDGLIDMKFTIFNRDIDKRVSKQQLVEFGKYILPRYHKTLFDYLKFMIVLWIPILSFFSYLFFFRSPYNFAEHLTINSFIYAHVLLIFLLFSPTYWIVPHMAATTAITSIGASLFFVIYSYMQVFDKRNYRLVKTILSLTISFTTYFVVLTSLTTFLAVWIALENVDKL